MTTKTPLYMQEIAILTAAKLLSGSRKVASRDAILAKAKDLLEGHPALDDRTLAAYFSNLVDTGLLARMGDVFTVTIRASEAVAVNLKVMSKVQNAAAFGMY